MPDRPDLRAELGDFVLRRREEQYAREAANGWPETRGEGGFFLNLFGSVLAIPLALLALVVGVGVLAVVWWAMVSVLNLFVK